jgi:site-specific recombinase XerD
MEALARFCDVEMPARNLSHETRRGYTYDLSEWIATAPSLLLVSALSTAVIAHYLSALDEWGLRGSTRHRKVAAIKTFLRYLEREGELPIDFSSRISWSEVQRDEPRALTVPEYTALLREAGHHPRDAAVLELLQTGIRLAELTALTVEDVSLPAKPSLDPINGYGLLRVRRKGRRRQELILNYKACRAPKAYLRVRPAAATPALFLTKYHEPISGRSVQKLMKKYAAAAGVGWVHVHTLRTTHITEHIARRTDIKTVQGNAGHASLATTNFYARYVKEAQIRAMQENAL